jgi:flagellar biosynthesis chaperone FliJ
VSWKLRPLLDLRRREEAEATQAMGGALAQWQASEAEAFVLRRRCADAAGLAERSGPGVEVARWAERLRQEAARLLGPLAEADARARAAATELELSRAALREAAVRRAVVERLETAWRRARTLEADRRAESALEDRPWRPGTGGAIPAVSASASRPVGSRRDPVRTGP